MHSFVLLVLLVTFICMFLDCPALEAVQKDCFAVQRESMTKRQRTHPYLADGTLEKEIVMRLRPVIGQKYA